MKRKLLLQALMATLLLTVGVQTARAQRPVGDTLTSMDPSYFPYNYNWFAIDNDSMFATIFCCNLSAGEPDGFLGWVNHDFEFPSVAQTYWGQGLFPTYPIGNMITGNQLYTDRPLKILGIAACGYMQKTTYIPLPWASGDFPNALALYPERFTPNVLDQTIAHRINDSLILYDITENGPAMITAGPWRVEDPHRFIVLPHRLEYPYPRHWEYDGLANRPTLDSTPTVPLYEVMFDKPQVVTDSFMVAGTYNNNRTQEVRYDYHGYTQNLWQHNPTRYWFIYYFRPDLPDSVNVTWMKYESNDWRRDSPTCNRWYGYAYNHNFFANLMFPIIDPMFDTNLCDEVRGVRVAESTDTSVTLMWNGGNAVRWEVNYVEIGASDDHTVTVTSPLAVLTGLRPRTDYMVHVRAMCEWDTEYGPWSDIVQFVTNNHHTQPESIDNLDRFTQVLPNPAHGQVSVLSSYCLSRVEVYDMQGRARLSHDEEGLSTVLDISSLPAGQYILVIHTPVGLATKKLTIL